MQQRPRWPRRGLLAVATAAVALACTMSGPSYSGSLGAASSPSAASGDVPLSGPLRIMPLGSSSTVGTGSLATAGFRGPLETLLAADHIAYDMVGSQHSGPLSLPDRDHEGHAGWTMRRMQPFVAGWIARQHPDVVLLQVGTNDLLTGTSATATAQRLDTVLTSTNAAASHAYVIVAGVWAPLPAHAPARAQFAHLASDVVSRHRAAGQATTFVDTSTLLSSTDLFDGLHPNAVGYRKIAGIWERAIRSYLIARERTRHPTLPSVDAVAVSRPPSPISGSGTPTSAVSKVSAGSAANPSTLRDRLIGGHAPSGTGQGPVQLSIGSSSRHRPATNSH